MCITVEELKQKLRTSGVRYVLAESYIAHAERIRLITKVQAMQLERDTRTPRRPMSRETHISNPSYDGLSLQA